MYLRALTPKSTIFEYFKFIKFKQYVIHYNINKLYKIIFTSVFRKMILEVKNN